MDGNLALCIVGLVAIASLILVAPFLLSSRISRNEENTHASPED